MRVISVENTLEKAAKEVKVPQRDCGEEAVVVWDAGLVLLHFLEKHQQEFVHGKNILEIGAGTGAVGLTAAALSAKSVALTDLERILPLLEEGIELNRDCFEKETVVEAQALAWGTEDFSPSHAPDLILVSDCLYYESSVVPLVTTLTSLVKKLNPSCQILVAYEERSYLPDKAQVIRSFFRLALQEFRLVPYKTSQCHEEFAAEDIRVVRLDLKC